MPTYEVDISYRATLTATVLNVEAQSKREAAQLVRKQLWQYEVIDTEIEKLGAHHVRFVNRVDN